MRTRTLRSKRRAASQVPAGAYTQHALSKTPQARHQPRSAHASTRIIVIINSSTKRQRGRPAQRDRAHLCASACQSSSARRASPGPVVSPRPTTTCVETRFNNGRSEQ